MIEKLENSEQSIYDSDHNFIGTMPTLSSGSLLGKINELVDAVNTIQKEREAEWFEIKEWIGILEAVRKSVNVHEKQIDELQMKLEPEKCKTPTDPYEKQRRWMGKLCWFSNGDGFDEVGYLTEIDPDMPEAKFRCNCHDYYAECKPVKPDDPIIYKGEHNE